MLGVLVRTGENNPSSVLGRGLRRTHGPFGWVHHANTVAELLASAVAAALVCRQT